MRVPTMFAYYMPSQLENMDEGMFEQYLRYTLNICESPDLTGVSNHSLDVLRRNEPGCTCAFDRTVGGKACYTKKRLAKPINPQK